jgi:hypothetical protein
MHKPGAVIQSLSVNCRHRGHPVLHAYIWSSHSVTFCKLQTTSNLCTPCIACIYLGKLYIVLSCCSHRGSVLGRIQSTIVARTRAIKTKPHVREENSAVSVAHTGGCRPAPSGTPQPKQSIPILVEYSSNRRSRVLWVT